MITERELCWIALSAFSNTVSLLCWVYLIKTWMNK